MTRPRTPIGGQDRDESSQVDADRRRAARPGCASSIQVNHDYDPEVDFAALRTFDWLPQPRPAGGGVRAALQRNSLLDSRVKKAVNGQLAAKGLAQSDHADLLLAYHTGSRNKVDVTDWGYGAGRWGGGRFSVHHYKEGTLILDVIDAKTKRLIWRGTAQGILDPDASAQEREQHIQDAVARMLANYPPAQPGAAGAPETR